MKTTGARVQHVSLKGRRMTLRPLRMGDLPALLAFAGGLFRERKTNPNLGIISLDRPVRVQDERDFLRKAVEGVRKGEVVSVAAFEGDVLAGNCEISRRKFHDVRHTGVLGIAIIEQYRGMGLGELMIRKALREAGHRGVWLVELQVFANNQRARGLYEKVGFREVGVVPNKMVRMGRPLDEVVMYIDTRTDKSTVPAARGS